MELTSVAAIRTTGSQNYAAASAAATRPTAQNSPAPAIATSNAVAQSSKKPDEVALQAAVDASNRVLANKTSNELHFAVDKGLSVVSLINQKSGETILQFPSEAMLQIAKGIDQVTGAIIQRKA